MSAGKLKFYGVNLEYNERGKGREKKIIFTEK